MGFWGLEIEWEEMFQFDLTGIEGAQQYVSFFDIPQKVVKI